MILPYMNISNCDNMHKYCYLNFYSWIQIAPCRGYSCSWIWSIGFEFSDFSIVMLCDKIVPDNTDWKTRKLKTKPICKSRLLPYTVSASGFSVFAHRVRRETFSCLLHVDWLKVLPGFGAKLVWPAHCRLGQQWSFLSEPS